MLRVKRAICGRCSFLEKNSVAPRRSPFHGVTSTQAGFNTQQAGFNTQHRHTQVSNIGTYLADGLSHCVEKLQLVQKTMQPRHPVVLSCSDNKALTRSLHAGRHLQATLLQALLVGNPLAVFVGNRGIHQVRQVGIGSCAVGRDHS